jgi:hypothetical protein
LKVLERRKVDLARELEFVRKTRGSLGRGQSLLKALLEDRKRDDRKSEQKL